MNRNCVSIVLIVCVLCAGTVFAVPPEGSGYSYKLVFEDNFNGTTLDTGKWNYNYPWGTYHNHQANCRPEQISVADGKMTITAIHERSIWDPWEIWHQDFGTMPLDYTSGAINTSGKFNFTRGYIEGSFKMSGAIGSWPAFWTLQSGWPPEIDILENPCWSSSVIDTYHYYYHYNPNNSSFGSTKTVSGLSTAFHTYGCEWTNTQMAWYFDNVQNGRWTNETAVSQSANMYMIINLAVGGWGGTPDLAQYPSTYSCDWVRVWQRIQDTTLDCIGHWELDETSGTTASDSSGKGMNGTLMGGLSFANDSTSGVIGTALSFDGVNDYVDLPDGFDEFDNGFTVSLWARPTAVKNWARFIDFGQGQDNDNILLARYGTSNDLVFQCFGGGSGGGYVRATNAIELNTWQHFAATVDAGGNVTLYKNGQPIKTGTTTWPWGVKRTQNFIGRSNWSADSYYQGDMDSILVYDYALSAAEIAALSLPPSFTSDSIENTDAIELEPYVGQSLADYVSVSSGGLLTFSKEAGPDWLTVSPDGTLSGTPQDSDAGPNGFTVRVTDDNGLYDTAQMTIQVDNLYTGLRGTEDLAGLAAEWLAQDCGLCNGADLDGDNNVTLVDFSILAHDYLVPVDLQLRLRFDEMAGSVAGDGSIYRRDGLLVNNPAWSGGIDGGALTFNGSNYVEVVDDAGLNPDADSFSVAFWMKSDTPSQGALIVSKRQSTNPYPGYLIGLSNGTPTSFSPGSKLTFLIGADSGDRKGGYTMSDIDFSEWTHVCVVLDQDADAVYIYIDGVSVSVNIPLDNTLATINTTTPVYIGKYPSISTKPYYGQIDDVRIYNTALTQQEIQTLLTP